MGAVLDAIKDWIGGVLFGLFNIIFVLIDALTDLFYGFAGIGRMNYGEHRIPIGSGNTGALDDTGIVYYLLQSDLVKNMFLSILLLGLFLLIIFSVMAFIKNAYAAKPKTWQEIVGNAFRGLANFVVVPVCCLLGIWGGNILLKAINGATQTSGATSLGGSLFISSAYNANKIRMDYEENLKTGTQINTIDPSVITRLVAAAGDDRIDFDFDIGKRGDMQYVASKVDELFAMNYEGFSYNSIFDVGIYYGLLDINYIVLIAGGLFMCYVLLSLVYAMIRRIFIILMLFIISPAVNSYYPLDEGKAAGSWKGEFVKQVTSAYGAVAGMNLFFSILPLIQSIKLAGIAGELLNVMGITELILVICGLLIVKEFISMISSYFGLENAYDKGTSMRSAVKGIQKKAAGVTKGVTGAFAKAMGARAGGGSFLGSLAGSVKDATVGKALEGLGISTKDMKKNYKDSKEETHKKLNEENKENSAKSEFAKLTDAKSTKTKEVMDYKVGEHVYHTKAEADAALASLKDQTDADGNPYKIEEQKSAMNYSQRLAQLTKDGRKLKDEDRAELLSFANGDTGVEKKIAKTFLSDLNEESLAKGKRSAYKHYNEDMVLEDRDRYNKGVAANVHYGDAQEGFNTAFSQMHASNERLASFKKDNGVITTSADNMNNQAFAGKLIIDEITGKALNVKSKTEMDVMSAKLAKGEVTQAQFDEQQEINALGAQYEELQKTANIFEQKFEQAAKTWQQAGEALAETQKGAIKEAYAEFASGIKSALTENASDMEKAANKIKESSENLADALKEANKKK
ncbi:MAG: Mbov_0396 family ICE element transmembrane protein [Clostridia bacterium]